MKLWIIYKEGLGFSKLIAEILQDRLEEGFIDVSVGSAKKIDPSLLVEEHLDYLIIGDIEKEYITDDEIKDWLFEFWNESKNRNQKISGISGFYVVLSESANKPLWIDFLQENLSKEKINPPILRLKLNIKELALEEETTALIKEFADKIIHFYVYKNGYNVKNKINEL